MARYMGHEFTSCDPVGKIAGIYVRVSREDVKRFRKDERDVHVKQSILTQRESGCQIAKDYGWDFKLYEDTNLSGTSGQEHRDGLNSLLSDIQAEKLHVVIVRDASRLYRDTQKSVNFLNDYLYGYGVDLISWLRPINIKTDSGRTEFEREAVSDSAYVRYCRKLSMTNRDAKAKAGTLAMNPYSYGFSFGLPNEPQIVDAEIDIVKMMFGWAAQGESYNGIAAKLMKMGVPTKHKHSEWTVTQIRSVLQNVRYRGQIRYKKVICDSPFPKVIDDELWERAQTAIAKNKLKGPRAINSDHLLTGILKCPYCEIAKRNTHMVYMKVRRGKKKLEHDYYRCQTKHFRHLHPEWPKCPSANLKADIIETFVADFIDELAEQVFQRDQPIEELLVGSEVDQLEAELGTVDKNLTKLRQRQNEITDRLITDDDDFDTLVEMLSRAVPKIKEDIAELETTSAELKIKIEIEKDGAFATAVNQIPTWRDQNIKKQREILEDLIVVYSFDSFLVVKLEAQLKRPCFKQSAIYPYDKYQSTGTDVKGRRKRGGRCIMRPDNSEFAAKVMEIVMEDEVLPRIATPPSFCGKETERYWVRTADESWDEFRAMIRRGREMKVTAGDLEEL